MKNIWSETDIMCTYCVQTPWNIHKTFDSPRDWNMKTMVILQPCEEKRRKIYVFVETCNN